MAIIYTYPVKGTPLAADLVLISDSADSNKSKNATIASLVTSNAIDVVDTLNSLKGDINITGGTNITVTPSGQNIEISTSASNVDGSGTANTIPKWSDSNTLTDSPFTIDTSTNSLDIPGYIRHVGDLDSLYGFSAANIFILETDSGRKITAGPDSVTLYSDTSLTDSTTSFNRLNVNTTGVVIYGQTAAAGATSSQGGLIKYYNDENNRYVGISGPITTGTSYILRLPDSVGTASQVLKLPSPIGTSPYQLAWGDAGGGSGSIIATADGGTGIGIASAAIYNILVGNGSTGASSAFVESGGVETAIQLPVGNTARRPSASAANVGLIRYNSETTNFEVCKETAAVSGVYSWYTISGLTEITE